MTMKNIQEKIRTMCDEALSVTADGDALSNENTPEAGTQDLDLTEPVEQSSGCPPCPPCSSEEDNNADETPLHDTDAAGPEATENDDSGD